MRNGKTTIDDWNVLMNTCSTQFPRKFSDLKVLKPCGYLIQIKKIIFIILTKNINQCRNDDTLSAGRATEIASKLSPRPYLCVGAKVMLLWNVNISLGLVNGSTRVINEFVIDADINATNMPNSIIIEFNDYSGPPYFSRNGQEKWVPICPEIANWGGAGDDDHFRKQFPICLAYALRVWKSQGMNIPGLFSISLGEVEKEHRLTFVALSRATDIVFCGQLVR